MNKVLAYIVCGWRVVKSGGNLNNGANAGVAYLNANNASSNANVNIGSHLGDGMKIQLNQKYAITLALAKIHNKVKRVLVVLTKALKKPSQMKRVNGLYDRIYDIENIRLAHKNARKGKSHYKEVISINENPDHYFQQIHEMLKNKTFKNGPYTVFIKHDRTKDREIHKLPYFPDRIIHHCIMQVLDPIWNKLMIRDSYASIKGRGIHDGFKRLKKALKDTSNTTYCLKLDIKKFYPSIDHNILKRLLRKKIKDNDVIWLLDTIIDSTKGVPIGNYLSQSLSNIYLTYFDHWIKEEKKIQHYFRYCDDMILLSDSKPFLQDLLNEIREYLGMRLNLVLKSNYQVFPVDKRGIDFLGYRFYHTHILLRKSIAKRIKRKILRLSNKVQLTYNDLCAMASYRGWTMHCNGYKFTQKYLLQIDGTAAIPAV